MLPFYRTFGVPTNFVSEWGERRQLSPNDACVIHCDLLAERERQKTLMILDILGNHIPAGTCMRSFERGRKLIAAQVVETSC
jgi:hypothetical protein